MMLWQLRHLASRSDCGSGIEIAALAIAGAAAVGGGLTSFVSARQAEEAAQAQERYQVKAFKENARQINSQMQMERFKAVNRANLIRSRIRVAAGESGIGYGGTYEALMNQADYDDYINSELIGANAMNAIRAAQSSIQPVPAVLNPLLAGMMGIIGGTASGLQIGANIMDIKRSREAVSGASESQRTQ